MLSSIRFDDCAFARFFAVMLVSCLSPIRSNWRAIERGATSRSRLGFVNARQSRANHAPTARQSHDRNTLPRNHLSESGSPMPLRLGYFGFGVGW